MALSDPLSITLNSVAVSLPKTSMVESRSSYTKDDGTVKVTASHQDIGKNNNARTRTVIRLDTVDIAADPLVAGINREAAFEAYLIINRPKVGITLAAQKDKVKGLLTLITASSDAVLTKILGGES
jgi:hypothetical protein